MSVYLAEWGGASSDKAYKHVGSLTVIGPFDGTEDAWAFSRILDDGLFDEFRQPSGFGVLIGQIEAVNDAGDTDLLGYGGGLTTPADRLRGEYGDQIEDAWNDPLADRRWNFTTDERVQLDRWLPGWELEDNHEERE